MGFKCGIVGLPNVGKSTLFNALTETAAAQAANYPFCTIEPNVGEVAVPDPRRDGKPARFVERKPEEEKLFHSLGLLTAQPVLYVCNVDEAVAATGNAYSRAVEQRAAEEGAASVVISAKIEAEIAVLPREEREHFLADIGLKEPGLDRLIRAGYALLHLVTFFTAGPKETRAWTVTKGSRAPQAAGAIHTDFERGFIRAETIAYEDYVKGGGEAGARDIGKLRLEGKEYEVADGDVLHFRFAT